MSLRLDARHPSPLRLRKSFTPRQMRLVFRQSHLPSVFVDLHRSAASAATAVMRRNLQVVAPVRLAACCMWRRKRAARALQAADSARQTNTLLERAAGEQSSAMLSNLFRCRQKRRRRQRRNSIVDFKFNHDGTNDSLNM